MRGFYYRTLQVILPFLVCFSLGARASEIPEAPFIQAGPAGLMLKKLPQDASELSEQQKCSVSSNERVELLAPPEAYSLAYLKVRLRQPRDSCRFLEGYVYARHVAEQSPVYYPFDKTDYWIETKEKGTYFKTSVQSSENLARGKDKCLMDPRTKYYLDGIPGQLASGHIRVSLANLIPGCLFTHGYVFAEHIQALSHPTVLVKPFEGPGDLYYRGAKWPSAWSASIMDAIPDIAPSLLDDGFVPQADIKSLCPGYFGATENEKKGFWALFLASIAYPESSWNPAPAKFKEPGLKDTYGQVYSEGLLQLSVGDGAHGAVCNFRYRSDIDIESPEDNLRCGLLILRNQIKSRRALFLPRSYYYWSVLTNKERTVRAVFNSQLNKLSYCF